MTARGLPKISLGFVVRRCTLALGHRPGAQEFSKWANTAGEHGAAIFGRPVTVQEADMILRHQGRPVTARTAQAYEVVPNEELPPELRASGDVRDKVVDFSAVRARRTR